MARTLQISRQGTGVCNQSLQAAGSNRRRTHAASLTLPGRVAPWRRLLPAAAGPRQPGHAAADAARAAPVRVDAAGVRAATAFVVRAARRRPLESGFRAQLRTRASDRHCLAPGAGGEVASAAFRRPAATGERASRGGFESEPRDPCPAPLSLSLRRDSGRGQGRRRLPASRPAARSGRSSWRSSAAAAARSAAPSTGRRVSSTRWRSVSMRRPTVTA